jgi:hypothetical protein
MTTHLIFVTPLILLPLIFTEKIIHGCVNVKLPISQNCEIWGISAIYLAASYTLCDCDFFVAVILVLMLDD